MLKPRFVHRLLRPRDFQARPELAAVCRWWRTRGIGVCALEGIGGAGKTAVVERFLRMLPGVMPDDASVSKDNSLPGPDAVFVFSFYDAPNPETFFWELAAWLVGGAEGTSSAKGRPPYGRINALLSRLGSALIVLDGLEKVQDDGARGHQFGAINDAHLRDFLIRAADGLIADVGILITTRFTMHDMYPLESQGPRAVERKPLPHFRPVAVDRLPPDACTNLFRNLGVQATSEQLDRLGHECGYHALTVDLFAGYIVRFLSGSASAALAVPLSVDLSMVPDSTTTKDRGTEYVRQQATRFTRVAARYREALEVSDPAALALLQRTCIFRLGVTADGIVRMFLGPSNREVAGPALSQLSPDGVVAKLEFLVQLHLLEGTGRDKHGRTIFTAHPAVREGFLSTVDRKTARHAHDAARRDIVASLAPARDMRLDLRPGERYPTSRHVLDQLEELIHHSLESGYAEEAYELYSARIGGARNLAAALGDYERGARLCASLLADKTLHRHAGRGNRAARPLLYVDWAVYLAGLGQVERALECFVHEAALVHEAPMSRPIEVSRSDDVAGLHLLAGRLATALTLASENLRSGVRAHARALRGDVSGALQDFQFALPSANWRPSAALVTRSPLFSLPALYHCSLLARLGPADEAVRATAYVKADIAWTLESDRHMFDAPANLLLAELAAQNGDCATADALVAEAHDWALERGAREILCWSALTRARVANARARQSEAIDPHVTTAVDACKAGLRIARESGFSVYHADLALELAQALLHRGDHLGATNAVKSALFGLQPVEDPAFVYDAPPRDEATPPRERLTVPPKTSGLPQILAATHPECHYAWAEGFGLHLLAEAAALAAAAEIGTTQIDPVRAPISPRVRELIAQATQYATKAMNVRRALRDPRWNETHAFASGLERGALTSYLVLAPAMPSSVSRANAAGPRVFVSYAHADNEHPEIRYRWLDRLLQHLAPLVQQRELSISSDHDQRIGDSWHDEIGLSLRNAIAAVLLVSPAFLASSYIRENELPILLQKARDEGLAIIPILVRPCLFAETTFLYPDPVTGPDALTLASLQTANLRARPLSAMSETEQDDTLVAVARHLLKMVRAQAG